MRRKGILTTHFKAIDLFTTNVGFRENGGNSFGSVFGACISLLVLLTTSLYGANKFFIMSGYEDTQFSEYLVKNELSDHQYSLEQLQFYFAFSAFDLAGFDEKGNVLMTNEDHEQYIEYSVNVFTQEGPTFTLDERIMTHKCNQTDKKYISQNLDFINVEVFEQRWPLLHCPDHPEKIALKIEEDKTS